MSDTDWQAYRCGHNFSPPACPYEKCGYRDIAVELAAVRAERDAERERAESNWQSLERIKEKYSACHNELKAAQADSRRLDWLDKYYELKITTTTIAGAAMKHIESDGTALYASGGDLRDTIDAAINGETYSTGA